MEHLFSMGSVYYGDQRATADLCVCSETVMRVHRQPRRFPSGDVDWSQRVIHATNELLIINKPTGIPMHATLDNSRENVLFELQNIFQQKLFITHRLDIDTQGLCVVARTSTMQKQINHWLVQKQVQRHYRARVMVALSPGTYVHFMDRSPRAPKHVHEQPPGLRCEMQVLNCTARATGYELDLKLGTGRTHQIRVQLQALQAPILGDSLYGHGSHEGPLHLQACALRIEPLDLEFHLPSPWP